MNVERVLQAVEAGRAHVVEDPEEQDVKALLDLMSVRIQIQWVVTHKADGNLTVKQAITHLTMVHRVCQTNIPDALYDL